MLSIFFVINLDPFLSTVENTVNPKQIGVLITIIGGIKNDVPVTPSSVIIHEHSTPKEFCLICHNFSLNALYLYFCI